MNTNTVYFLFELLKKYLNNQVKVENLFFINLSFLLIKNIYKEIIDVKLRITT